MQLSDFDFPLPADLIATRPARPRSAARLLAAGPQQWRDLHMTDLPTLLGPGDRLVLNDTRVIPARLQGYRERSGAAGTSRAAVEVMLAEPLPGGQWRALVKPLRKLREGEVIRFGAGLEARLESRAGGFAVISFNLADAAFDAALQVAGSMPLPPYILARREADAADRQDYQAIWAERPGAVAAPTASLHFDAPLLAALAVRGVAFSRVTLHVGAGTFLPVKTEEIEQHHMHAEWGELTPTAAAEIAATRAAGGRIIAVGTTALRLLEAAAASGTVEPFRGHTAIFIRPGYRFRAVDGLVTNFHLPRSTLLMLVAALMGLERIRQIYAHAVASRYRFFSYGDASLLLPRGLDRVERTAAT